ncbi:MAG: hypothetical protein QOE23_3079, partial [Pseudonocardiales bacterium]|nr:hypothetical protein [Pseudonocardiales bacterium]
MTDRTKNEASAPKHRWLTGERQGDRTATWQGLLLPPPVTPAICAHRYLRGPYTAAGALLQALVPRAIQRRPELVARHEIEILTAAPALRSIVPATLDTLTSLAVPDERTRFYSGMRTLRLAHGLTEFVRDCLRDCGEGAPRSVFFDDVQHADRTDQEFLAVLLRRIDPALLTVVVGTGTDFGAGEPVVAPSAAGAAGRSATGGLAESLLRFCDRIESIAVPVAADGRPDDRELARAFVDTDCTSDDPDAVAAYHRIPDEERRALHDERAGRLDDSSDPALAWGAIPLHRLRGSQPLVEGARAMSHALNECMKLGFYDATIEFCERGRAIVDWETNPELRWFFTTKLPTSLSAIGRGEEAEAICDEGRAHTREPLIHRQLAYATSMLYIRHLQPHKHDIERALGWIKEAIALSSLFEDPKEREFGVVFNQNGRALIEVRRGRPEVALELVEAGIARLDDYLEPDQHLLHRSVLKYNRAQVLAGMGRIDEALADYRAVIALDPNYPEYHFDVANLLHR